MRLNKWQHNSPSQQHSHHHNKSLKYSSDAYLNIELPALSKSVSPSRIKHTSDNRNSPFLIDQRRLKPRNCLRIIGEEQNTGKTLSMHIFHKADKIKCGMRPSPKSQKTTKCVPLLKYPLLQAEAETSPKHSKEQQLIKKEQFLKSILKKIHLNHLDQQFTNKNLKEQTTLDITRIKTEAVVEQTQAPRMKLGKGRNNLIKQLRELKDKVFHQRQRHRPIGQKKHSRHQPTNPEQNISSNLEIGPWISLHQDLHYLP